MIYSKNEIFAIKKTRFLKNSSIIDEQKKNIFQNHDRNEFFDFARII